MTIAEYNKLSKEEQFENRIKKMLDNMCFINDNGVAINLKTDSEIVFNELNKFGIETKDKTIDEIFNNLELMYDVIFIKPKNERETASEKLCFFLSYIAFLALYLVNNDVKRLSIKYKEQIKIYLDYIEFIDFK